MNAAASPLPPSSLDAGRRAALGGAAVEVTRLSFGAAPIGNLYRPVTEEDAEGALEAAWKAGVRYFDTAPHYGFGLSEERLGRFLRTRLDGDKAVVSTKVGRVLEPVEGAPAGLRHGFADARPFEPRFDYSHDGVLASFEESLERLGVDRVDILLAHDLGRVTHGDAHKAHWNAFSEGGWRAMARLREERAVSALGIGANEWEVCAAALERFDMDCFLLAGRYTLLEQDPLDSFFPLCESRGVAVISAGPFNSGILATGADENATYNYARAPDAVRARVAAIDDIARRFGVRMADAAVQFPSYAPCVSSVLAGFASAAEVEAARRGFEADIPKEFWAALREANLLRENAPAPDRDAP